MPVRTKRIYDPPSHGDGYRVLIDGILAARHHARAPSVLGDVVRRGLR